MPGLLPKLWSKLKDFWTACLFSCYYFLQLILIIMIYLYRNVNKTKFTLNVTGVVAWWLWAAIGKIRHGKSYKSWQYSSQNFELEKQNLPKSFLNVLNVPVTFSMLTHPCFVRAVRWLWYPKQHWGKKTDTSVLKKSGAPNNGFLLNTLKTLFRLSRVLLDL